MRTRFLAIAAAALVIAACSTGSAPRGSSSFEKEGWTPFSSARTGDPPGRIYRVERSGRVFEVTEVKAQTHTDYHQVYRVSGKTEFTLGEVLKAIGLVDLELPLSVRVKLDRRSEFFTESLQGMREFLEDRDVTDKAVADALSGIRIRADNTYYLIRETLSSNNLKFRVSKNWLVDLGVDADMKKAVRSKTNLTWQDGNEVSVDAKFDALYRIWYKPERLDIKQNLGAGPGQPPSVTRVRNATEFKLPANVERVP